MRTEIIRIDPLQSTTAGADASYYGAVVCRAEQAPDGYYYRLRNGKYHLVKRPKKTEAAE